MSLCILTNADAGIQRAGQVVRMVGATALLALADTSPHSTDLVGVRLSDVNPGVGGYVAPFMSGLTFRCEVGPVAGDLLYLSAINPGYVTPIPPVSPFLVIPLGRVYDTWTDAGVIYAEVINVLATSDTVYVTAKGDLITFDGTSVARLAVGTNGQVLTSRSTAPNGIDWETPATALSPAGSIFSLTGPLGAAGAILGWDFSRYDPTLSLVNNLYNCNISGDPLNATPAPAGTPTYSYRGLLAGGFALNPAWASNQGGALQDDAGTNTSGSVGNSVRAVPANNDIRIIADLTIEACFAVSAMSTTAGDNWSVVTCCGEGETENENVLYSLGFTIGAGPVFTVGYTAEHGAGVNITATLAVIQAIVGTGYVFWTLTRDSLGRVRFYINGQAVSALITPTDAGGGGVILPTRGAAPAQTLQLSRVGTAGTNLKQWQALKITPACFTSDQVQESYRRSRFGVGSSIS